MKGYKTYKVTCHKCQATEEVIIDSDNTIHWRDQKAIISGRYRLDMNWGWQCARCGNNDLVTKQEVRTIRNLQAPDPNDISKVLKNLIPDKPRFKMETN